MNEGSEIPSDDALVFIVQLHLKPERVEDWKRAVNELIDRMSQEDAFVTCLLDQSTEDPGMFTLYERWREPSLEAFVRNQMKDYRKRYEEMLLSASSSQESDDFAPGPSVASIEVSGLLAQFPELHIERGFDRNAPKGVCGGRLWIKRHFHPVLETCSTSRWLAPCWAGGHGAFLWAQRSQMACWPINPAMILFLSRSSKNFSSFWHAAGIRVGIT